MDILIVGTGAMATLFASRLASAGVTVSMLGAWPEALTAIRENGVRFIDANGSEKRFSVHATNDPREVRGTKFAIVLVKSWQTERAAQQLSQCLAEDGLAITIQNGIGNREILEKYLNELSTTESAEKNLSRVALGSTTSGATLLGPGLVKAGGEGKISIEARPALGPMEEALKSANFNVEIVRDARSIVWGKLVINSAINPLTALLKIPNGELLDRPSARALMRALAEETASVAKAEKVKLPFKNPADAVEDVARKTATNFSSMLQDVQRGAPTEIDSICGEISRIGKLHRTPTPLNDACLELVHALLPG
jgi:2-dehydropantoate 2-reductase